MCSHVFTDCDCFLFIHSAPSLLSSHITSPLFPSIPNTGVRGRFRTISPTETPSLDAPLSESLSPSPAHPPTLRTQKPEEEKETLEVDGGDRTVSVPCYEIHATGLRRCSEPLTFNLLPPRPEALTQTLSDLIISSEQRFFSRYDCFPPSNLALTTSLLPTDLSDLLPQTSNTFMFFLSFCCLHNKIMFLPDEKGLFCTFFRSIYFLLKTEITVLFKFKGTYHQNSHFVVA